MKYVLVALISGLVGLAIGYSIWGAGISLNDTSFISEPIPTQAERAATSNESEVEEVNAPSTTTSGEAAISVETSAMSPEQQQLLRSFGIDPEGVTVTVEMIACAEAAVGKERLNTIMGGAIPTFFESAKLLGCYQQ